MGSDSVRGLTNRIRLDHLLTLTKCHGFWGNDFCSNKYYKKLHVTTNNLFLLSQITTIHRYNCYEQLNSINCDNFHRRDRCYSKSIVIFTTTKFSLFVEGKYIMVLSRGDRDLARNFASISYPFDLILEYFESIFEALK